MHLSNSFFIGVGEKWMTSHQTNTHRWNRPLEVGIQTASIPSKILPANSEFVVVRKRTQSEDNDTPFQYNMLYNVHPPSPPWMQISGTTHGKSGNLLIHPHVRRKSGLLLTLSEAFGFQVWLSNNSRGRRTSTKKAGSLPTVLPFLARRPDGTDREFTSERYSRMRDVFSNVREKYLPPCGRCDFNN